MSKKAQPDLNDFFENWLYITQAHLENQYFDDIHRNAEMIKMMRYLASKMDIAMLEKALDELEEKISYEAGAMAVTIALGDRVPDVMKRAADLRAQAGVLKQIIALVKEAQREEG